MAICASGESHCKKRPVYAVGGYTRSLKVTGWPGHMHIRFWGCSTRDAWGDTLLLKSAGSCPENLHFRWHVQVAIYGTV